MVVRVEATMTAMGQGALASDKMQAVQDAMVSALREALDRGVSDPAELRRVQIEARDQATHDY